MLNFFWPFFDGKVYELCAAVFEINDDNDDNDDNNNINNKNNNKKKKKNMNSWKYLK